MRDAAAILFVVAALLSGQEKQRPQTFTGVITDSQCANGDHSNMKMGSDDRECTIACVHAHGADYVLSDGRQVYVLANQDQAEQFAGQKVTITGIVRDKMLEVQSIKPQPAKQGK
jgi:hypothetical protein